MSKFSKKQKVQKRRQHKFNTASLKVGKIAIPN